MPLPILGLLGAAGRAALPYLPTYSGIAGPTTTAVAGAVARGAAKLATSKTAVAGTVLATAPAVLSGTGVGEVLKNAPGADTIGKTIAALFGPGERSAINPKIDGPQPITGRLGDGSLDRIGLKHYVPDFGQVGPAAPGPRANGPATASSESAGETPAPRRRIPKVDHPYDPNFGETIASILDVAREANATRDARAAARDQAAFQREILKAQIAGQYQIEAAKARAGFQQPKEHVITGKDLSQQVVRSNPDGTATVLQQIQPLPPGVTAEQFSAGVATEAQRSGDFAAANAILASRGLPPLAPPPKQAGALDLVIERFKSAGGTPQAAQAAQAADLSALYRAAAAGSPPPAAAAGAAKNAGPAGIIDLLRQEGLITKDGKINTADPRVFQ